MENYNTWERFCISGKVEDYLQYVQSKDMYNSIAEKELVSNANFYLSSGDQGLLPR